MVICKHYSHKYPDKILVTEVVGFY